MINVSIGSLAEYSEADYNHYRAFFSIEDHKFLIVFTLIDETLAVTYDYIDFKIHDNSYVIKFDRVENYESGDFYQKAAKGFSKIGLKEFFDVLGQILIQIIENHYSLTGTKIYFFSAERKNLKSFYDRLIQYADELQFEVISNIGEGGLTYAIKTPKYQRNKD